MCVDPDNAAIILQVEHDLFTAVRNGCRSALLPGARLRVAITVFIRLGQRNAAPADR